MSREKQEAFRRRLNAELADVRVPESRKEALFRAAMGEKRKRAATPVLIAALVLAVAGAALAAGGGLEKLRDVWRDSFGRMDTVDILPENAPGEADLTVEQALAAARAAVLDIYGTPAEELDAMGAYPEFIPAQGEDPAEWRVYFSPRTGQDLNDDHPCPAPGEYRVTVESPAGNVTFCRWYNDDFWPEYALRAWNAGKHDAVYEMALESGFFRQSAEDRALFTELFAAEGRDIAPFGKSAEQLLADMETQLMFADPADDLLGTESPEVSAALKALEAHTGLTREMLKTAGYAAVYSPVPADTADVCFAYNYRLEEEAPGDHFAGGYASRLGLFMVRLEKDTLRAAEFVHVSCTPASEKADDPGTLLGRREWTGKDLPEFEALLAELDAVYARYEAFELSEAEMKNARDRIMLTYGGDPSLYTADHEDDGTVTLREWLHDRGLSEVQVIEAGEAYLAEHTGYTREQLARASFSAGTAFGGNGEIPTLLVLLQTEGVNGVRWYLQFDLDLNVTHFEESYGNLHG